MCGGPKTEKEHQSGIDIIVHGYFTERGDSILGARLCERGCKTIFLAS